MTSEKQKHLFQLWAEGTGFALDTTEQPEAEFVRLAKVKGWVGGDQNWRMCWALCFEEHHPYRASTTTANFATENITTIMPGKTRKAGPVGHARRLSATSDLSSYSLVSGAPTVYSLDANGSVDGGVTITPPADDDLETVLSALTIEDSEISVGTELSRSLVRSNFTLKTGDKPARNPSTYDLSRFWLQFVGFDPDPTATFKTEFARLAAHQDWSTKTKRQRQVEALAEEISFHFGICMNKLDHWQQLCKDVGVEDIPGSITKCKKALRPVMVNLYNLIDHRRNPNIVVRKFKSYAAFCKFTRAGRTFPKECAKQDAFIRVLLKKM